MWKDLRHQGQSEDTSATRDTNILCYIAGPGGGEWPVASPLPPPRDSRMEGGVFHGTCCLLCILQCSSLVDLGTGGGLALKSTKISYQKNDAKSPILGTSYLIIEIFLGIPV